MRTSLPQQFNSDSCSTPSSLADPRSAKPDNTEAKCSICSKICAHQHSLRQHITKKHPGCKLPPYEQQAYTCLGPGTKRTLAEKRRAHCEYQKRYVRRHPHSRSLTNAKYNRKARQRLHERLVKSQQAPTSTRPQQPSTLARPAAVSNIMLAVIDVYTSGAVAALRTEAKRLHCRDFAGSDDTDVLLCALSNSYSIVSSRYR